MKTDGQKIDPKTGEYFKDVFVASTMAIFPTQDPAVIIYAVIDHPKGPEYYGGRIAAPVVRELAERIIPILGIPKETDTVIKHPGVVKIRLPEKLTVGDRLPDLTGLSKRQILPLFSLEGITVEISGEGWVVSQFPAPGNSDKKRDGSKIKLR